MPTTTKTPTPSASDSSHLLAGCQNKAHSFGCLQRFHSDCAPSSKLGEIRFSYFPLSGFRPIPKEKYDFLGPRTLTHAAVVFLLVKKSMCACLPCHNFVLPASRCPQRNYCQLELAVRLMVKEGLIIKCVGRPAVRREKYFPPAVFETTTTTACAPRSMSSILYPKGHSLARSLVVTLIVIRKTKDKAKGLRISCPHFPSSAH